MKKFTPRDFSYIVRKKTFRNNTPEYKFFNSLEGEDWETFLDGLAAYALILEYDNLSDSFIIYIGNYFHSKTR